MGAWTAISFSISYPLKDALLIPQLSPDVDIDGVGRFLPE